MDASQPDYFLQDDDLRNNFVLGNMKNALPAVRTILLREPSRLRDLVDYWGIQEEIDDRIWVEGAYMLLLGVFAKTMEGTFPVAKAKQERALEALHWLVKQNDAVIHITAAIALAFAEDRSLIGEEPDLIMLIENGFLQVVPHRILKLILDQIGNDPALLEAFSTRLPELDRWERELSWYPGQNPFRGRQSILVATALAQRGHYPTGVLSTLLDYAGKYADLWANSPLEEIPSDSLLYRHRIDIEYARAGLTEYGHLLAHDPQVLTYLKKKVNDTRSGDDSDNSIIEGYLYMFNLIEPEMIKRTIRAELLKWLHRQHRHYQRESERERNYGLSTSPQKLVGLLTGYLTKLSGDKSLQLKLEQPE